MNLEATRQLSEFEGVEHARVLNVSGSRSGNVLLVVGEGEERKVLKVYRERRGRAKEALSGVSHRIFERKRGTTARARARTERLTLDVWQRAGCDVFRRLDLPLPQGVAPPAVWFEFYSGKTMSKVLEAPGSTLEKKESLLRDLGSILQPRHALALERSQPLLAHEHGTLNHVFVTDSRRLMSFDFEGGFLPRFPVLEALAQEVAGYVRSLRRRSGGEFQRLLEALIEGYGEASLLREIASWGVHHRSYYRRVRRWYDERRRAENTKTDGLRILLAALSPTPGVSAAVEKASQ